MLFRSLLDRAEKIFRGGETIEILGISEDSVFGAKEIGYEHGADYADAVLAKSVQILKDGYGNGKEDEVDNAAKKCFSILLTHEPQYLEQYAESGVNLVFAGHAHGGQFRLPGGQGLFSPGQGVRHPVHAVYSGHLLHRGGQGGQPARAASVKS